MGKIVGLIPKPAKQEQEKKPAPAGALGFGALLPLFAEISWRLFQILSHNIHINDVK